MVLKMKNIIRILTFAGFLFAVMFSGCGKNEEAETKDKTASLKDTIPVQTVLVEKKDLKISKTFSGSLEGAEQAIIVAKIPERIVSIKTKVGDAVSAGQLLIELDKSGATSQFYQAQAGFLNAEKDLQRMKALLSEGAVSQQMFDGSQTAFNIAKANFDAAKSSVELTTPISGVVTAININVGDLAQVGMPLVVVASIGSMKMIFNAGEGDIASLAIGQPADIYSELKPDLIRKGRISQISKSADIQSRTFEIKALFGNTPDRWFKPGMFCRGKVDLKSQKESLVIPSLAVINDQNSKGVYVVENNIAHFRKISTGLTDGTNIEILSGLKEGETVATIGMNNLKEGAFVHVAK